MLDSQNYEREKIESAEDEQVNDENDCPLGSYYYDDVTGYDVYQDDESPELQKED